MLNGVAEHPADATRLGLRELLHQGIRTARTARLTADSDFVNGCGCIIPHMKAYSTDLRERITHAVKHDHKPPEEVATIYQVSPATIYRYLQLHRDLNDLIPLKSTGRKRKISPEHEPRLLEQLNANNDATLEEHCQLWKKHMGITVSLTCMFESLKCQDFVDVQNRV